MASIGAPDAAAASKRNRSENHPVQSFFSFNELLDVSQCLIQPPCRKQTIAGKHSGNLEKYLKVHHPQVHNNFLDARSKDGENSAKRKKKSNTVTLNGVNLSGPEILRSCVRMVSAHGRPLALMDDDAFQSIIRPLVNALPLRERFAVSSKSIADLIPTYADKVRRIISEEVQGRLVCLKVDGVSRYTRHFIGINIQYIADAKIVVRTLAVKEMFSRHTGLNIKSEILSTLDLFGIDVGNVFSSTSDTGANMLKAAALLKEAQAELENYEIDTAEWFPLCDTTEVFLQIVKCAAHILQLAILDAIKKTETIETLKKARNAAVALRTPNQVKQLHRDGYTMPVLDVVTRWGSSYDMASSVLALKSYIEKNESDDERLVFAEEDWEELEEVIEAMKPSREATTVLQDSQLLLGDFYATWMKCKYRTGKIKGALAESIVKNMESREKARTNSKGEEKLPSLFDYPGFTAAMLLDPCFFSILSAEEIDHAKAYLSNLWVRLQRLKTGAGTSTGTEESSVAQTGDRAIVQGEEGEDEFIAFLMAKNSAREQAVSTSTPASTIGYLVDTYLKTTKSLPLDSNVLEYWESQRFIHPEVYELATTVLAIPATQVSVEKLFSSLSFILNPLRLNLSSQRVDDLLFLHANDDIAQQENVHVGAEADMNELHMLSSTAPSSSSSSSLSPLPPSPSPSNALFASAPSRAARMSTCSR